MGLQNDDAAEIHPVYSIDVVQDWTQRMPTANLTGVWAGGDVGTYYVQQIGNTVWWVGMSRDQGRTFTNVFRGTIGTEYIQNGWRQVINGEWVDVPLGGNLGFGTLKLVGTYCLPDGCDVTRSMALYNNLGAWAVTGGFSGQAWEKLYDRQPTVRPAPAQ